MTKYRAHWYQWLFLFWCKCKTEWKIFLTIRVLSWSLTLEEVWLRGSLASSMIGAVCREWTNWQESGIGIRFDLLRKAQAHLSQVSHTPDLASLFRSIRGFPSSPPRIQGLTWNGWVPLQLERNGENVSDSHPKGTKCHSAPYECHRSISEHGFLGQLIYFLYLLLTSLVYLISTDQTLQQNLR